MEVKIVCSCGQRYQFEVEPVDGRMPVEIACPKCGADGTARANEIIAESFPHPSTPVPPTTSIAAPPAPITGSSFVMSMAVPETPTKLRISRPAPPPDTNDAA